jgi:hypothetical protein
MRILQRKYEFIKIAIQFSALERFDKLFLEIDKKNGRD